MSTSVDITSSNTPSHLLFVLKKFSNENERKKWNNDQINLPTFSNNYAWYRTFYIKSHNCKHNVKLAVRAKICRNTVARPTGLRLTEWHGQDKLSYPPKTCILSGTDITFTIWPQTFPPHGPHQDTVCTNSLSLLSGDIQGWVGWGGVGERDSGSLWWRKRLGNHAHPASRRLAESLWSVKNNTY